MYVRVLKTMYVRVLETIYVRVLKTKLQNYYDVGTVNLPGGRKIILLV